VSDDQLQDHFWSTQTLSASSTAMKKEALRPLIKIICARQTEAEKSRNALRDVRYPQDGSTK